MNAGGGRTRALLKIFGFCLAVFGCLITCADAGSPQPGTLIISKTVAYYKNAKGKLMPSVEAKLEIPIGSGPYLKLAATLSSATPAPGDPVTITIEYENVGNQPATDVTVTAQIIPGMSITAFSPGATRLTSPDCDILVWKPGTLLIGARETVTVTGKALGAIPLSGMFLVSSAEKSTATLAVTTQAQAVKSSSKTVGLTTDCSGTVFDSATGKPLPGAVVTLLDPSGQQVTALPKDMVTSVTTGSNGSFAFTGIPEGGYTLAVKPDKSHMFPSRTAAEKMRNFTITAGSYGRPFTASAAAPLMVNIPVDPLPPVLNVTLLANKYKVIVGELVRYVAVIKNIGTGDANNVLFEASIPPGFGYMANSAKLSTGPGTEPARSAGGLSWSLPVLKAGSSIEVTFVLVAGVGSMQGGGICTASASVAMNGNKVVSNLAAVAVLVTGGVFTSNGTIIGKLQLPTLQKRDLSGIILYLEDGTRVTTDRFGRYSFAMVSPGIHVVRLLETSLPPDLTPASGEVTYYAEVVPSGLAKVNIRLAHDPAKTPVAPATSVPATPPALPAPPAPTIPPAVPAPPAPPAPPTPPTSSAPPPPSSPPSPMSEPPVEPQAPVGLKKESSSVSMPESHSVPSTSDTPGAPTTPALPTGEAPAIQSNPNDPTVAELTAGMDDAAFEKRIHAMDSTLEFLSPDNDLVVNDSRRTIIVKGPADAELNLTLNGTPVDKKAIGKSLVKRKTNTAIYEYVGIILPRGRKSSIRATVVTPFGKEIATKELTIRVTGAPARIEVEVDHAKVRADGKSVITCKARIVDVDGLFIPYQGTMTVAANKGVIVEKDKDMVTSGLQILGENGIFTIHVVAPRDPGDAMITLSSEDIVSNVPLFFSPNLAPLLFSGVGEIVLGRGSGTTPGYGRVSNGFTVDTRGAFFAKGELIYDIMLTASYDSNKTQQSEFFRADVLNPESEEPYPTYGDDSATVFETASRDKFYVRLEKDRSYLMYGDYYTNFNTTKLAAYNRTLTGVKTQLSVANASFVGFGSNTDVTKVVDTIAGQGISGYYFLTRPVFSGSERVVLETRDRLQTSRVLSRVSLQRGNDYTIDYQLGALMFVTPVPIRDANMNPVYIIVIYESHDNNGKHYGVYGGRGIYRPTSWLEVGGTGILEESEVGNNNITGTDVTLRLPANTIIRGEWAHSTAVVDSDALVASQDGTAWLAEVTGMITPRLTYLGYYITIDKNYRNSTATDVTPGTRRYGAEMKYQDPVISAGLRYFDEHDYVNNTYHRYAGLGAVRSFGLNKIGLLLYNESGSQSYTQVNVSPSRTPFNINETPPEEVVAAKVSFEVPLTPTFSLEGSYRQDLLHNKYNLAQAGASYRINPKQRLYVRQELGVYSGPTQLRTIAGVEAEIAANTNSFMEYRFSSGSSDGEKNQSSTGIRKRIFVNENLAVNLSFESLHSFTGTTSSNYPDIWAATMAMDYQIPDILRSFVKLEYQNQISTTPQKSYLVETGAQYRTSPDYSLIFRERFMYGIQGQGTRVVARTTLGLAYRPVADDRFNGLMKLEYKRDQDSIAGSGIPTNADVYLGSLEGTYQVSEQLQVTGKYAGKLVDASGMTSLTTLASARFVYDIGRNFDCSGEYRLLMNNSQGGVFHGGTAEAGYRIKDNLWLSLGYAFDKFDSDLMGDAYQGQGPFFRIRMKVDEHMVKRALQ